MVGISRRDFMKGVLGVGVGLALAGVAPEHKKVLDYEGWDEAIEENKNRDWDEAILREEVRCLMNERSVDLSYRYGSGCVDFFYSKNIVYWDVPLRHFEELKVMLHNDFYYGEGLFGLTISVIDRDISFSSRDVYSARAS